MANASVTMIRVTQESNYKLMLACPSGAIAYGTVPLDNQIHEWGKHGACFVVDLSKDSFFFTLEDDKTVCE